MLGLFKKTRKNPPDNVNGNHYDDTYYQRNDSDLSTPPEEEFPSKPPEEEFPSKHCKHFADDLNQKFIMIAKRLQENGKTDYKQRDDSGCRTPPEDDGFSEIVENQISVSLQKNILKT